MAKALKGAWLFIVCLLLVACSGSDHISEAHQAVEGYLDLQGWDFRNDGIISLSGDWAFYWDELLLPSEIETDSTTRYVSVPDSWTNYEINGQPLPVDGFSTYRLIVQLPDSPQGYGLFIEGEGTAYNLWVDGQLVAKNGQVATNLQETTPQSKPEVAFFQPGNETTEFVVQISNFHHRKAGFRNAIILGLPSQIHNHQRDGWAEDGFVLGIYLVMGIYHLFIFYFRPANKSTLYFALWSFQNFIRGGLLDQELIVFLLPKMSWELSLRIEYLTFYLSAPLYALFIYHLYPKDFQRRVLHAIVGLGVMFSVFMVFINTLTLSYTATIYQGIILAEILYFIFFVGRILKRKRDGALVIALASFVGFAGVVLEVLYLQNIISFEINSVYTFQAFIFIQAIMLASRFSRSFKRVEDLSAELEKANINLRESEKKYRSIFEESKEMIFIAGLDEQIKDANPVSEEILGYKKDELTRMKMSDLLVHNHDKEKIQESLRKNAIVRDYELELLRKDKDIIHGLITITIRRDDTGMPIELQGNVHDISSRREAESERVRAMVFEQLAITDPLTNIYNRRVFDEIANKEWERAKRIKSPLTIVLFDVDHFKKINDTHGHMIGDQVLTNLAKLCLSNMRNMDIIARYGGEEFIILMPDTDSGSAYPTIERLRNYIEKTQMTTHEGQGINITISAGIVTWAGLDDLGVQTLIHNADQALYTSKQTGRNKTTIWKEA